jgi:hypothetical protein
MIRTFVSIACASMSLAALADAQLQMVDKDGRIDGTYQVKGGKVRMDSVDSGNMSIIYDSASHGMTVLDHGKKNYMRIDAETAATAGAAVSDAMAMLEKQLEGLPPEQREAMKQYLPQLPGGSTSIPKIAADRTGKSETVNGAPCDLVNVTMDGEPLGEACIASKGVGLSDADQATLRTMFDDMSKVASSVLGNGARTGQQFAALGGVPLRWREAGTGRVTDTRVDTKVAIDASAFEIPAGYTEEKIAIPSLR